MKCVGRGRGTGQREHSEPGDVGTMPQRRMHRVISSRTKTIFPGVEGGQKGRSTKSLGSDTRCRTVGAPVRQLQEGEWWEVQALVRVGIGAHFSSHSSITQNELVINTIIIREFIKL